MKKSFLYCFIYVFTCLALPAYASDQAIEPMAARSIEKLTAEYSKKFPATGMKKGLCVTPFSEDSTQAKDRGLGGTIREIVSSAISQSQVFFLIDRDTLSSRMK